MQSTLKRGLYAPATTVLQALGSFFFAGLVFRPVTERLSAHVAAFHSSGQVRGIWRLLPMQLKRQPNTRFGELLAALRLVYV